MTGQVTFSSSLSPCREGSSISVLVFPSQSFRLSISFVSPLLSVRVPIPSFFQSLHLSSILINVI